MTRLCDFSKSTRWSLIWFSHRTTISHHASAPTSAPKPRLRRSTRPSQAHSWHLSLTMCHLTMCHCSWIACHVGAPFSTEQMRLVRVRPRLRAVPLVAAANLAADLHLLASLAAVSPAVADVLASLGTTLGRTMVSAFVFVCAPPTSWAIGGRHCS